MRDVSGRAVLINGDRHKDARMQRVSLAEEKIVGI